MEIGKRQMLYEMCLMIRIQFFSIFSRFFGFSVHYIRFLHLNESDEEGSFDLQDSLSLLDQVLKRASKKRLDKGVKLLLKSMNWRPHLVGLVAILKMEKIEQEKFCAVLWDLAEKEYSWVLPQIYATISLIDDDFVNKSKNVLKKKGRDILDNKECEIDYLLKNLECMNEVTEDYDAYSVSWRERIIDLGLLNS